MNSFRIYLKIIIIFIYSKGKYAKRYKTRRYESSGILSTYAKKKYHSDPLEKVKGNIKYYKGLYKENPDFMKIYNNQELNLLERQYEMKQFHFNLKLAKLSA